MSESEMFTEIQTLFGLKSGWGDSIGAGQAQPGVEGKAVEKILATGLGSRGGPNKVSNKYKSSPSSYLLRCAISSEYFVATGLRSRGGPNKMTNKLKRRLISYLYD